MLSETYDWFANPSDSTQRCWWITGLVTVGKSTLAVSIAKNLEADKWLLLQSLELPPYPNLRSRDRVSPPESGSVYPEFLILSQMCTENSA